ncbi:MAG TPA: antitoxin Xre/MbcA/ParS toxin-binding domain-containing protein [Thermoanaerobaculia bacterium]|nr:antitoxin Xre/MbcA/ParS toxin-binding domain-containing protein [Thermoanaerobaculia bacterium]
MAFRDDVERFNALTKKGRPIGRSYVVLLGLNVIDLPGILAIVEKGFSWKTVERFAENTGFTIEQVGELIAVPKRTLMRRKAEKRLAADESDRLLRAARIYGKSLVLFDGSREAATEWLTEANRALGGVAPIEYAKTEVGAEEIEHVIGRIEHGIFA